MTAPVLTYWDAGEVLVADIHQRGIPVTISSMYHGELWERIAEGVRR